ncbi:ATP-dependent helicase HrpB [Altererythrobacter sp. CAU 1778]
MADLPIHAVLPQLCDALSTRTAAVLIAPPGAGKTTAVAPRLLDEPWCQGQIILTSPRRVAARAAAERMAAMLGEKPGETVGYVTRLDTKQSKSTRVVVMTEAIFVSRILGDQELGGISAVLFDEAHERSIDIDLGLALAIESQSVLRPDLRICVMSATIDGDRFAALLDNASVVTSEGKAHPLEIRWLGSSPQQRIEDASAEAVRTAWRETEGDILAFLPGVREIERTQERLAAALPSAVLLPLHSQVRPEEQRRALVRDAEGRRRIVLATSIAETSLTLDGVSVVVDSGLARRPAFDVAAGLSHLITTRASRAAADQRAGRAARQGPGVAYRLWEQAAHTGRIAYDPPEIANSDLAPMALALAQWGASSPQHLPLLDPPPAPAWDEALARLKDLGAVGDNGAITARGKELAALPMHPVLAAMVLAGAEDGQAEDAACLALLLQERGLGGRGEDLLGRLDRFRNDRGTRAEASRKLARRWAGLVAVGAERVGTNPAVFLAQALPRNLARRRDRSGESWHSVGGRGFVLDPASPLASAEWLAIGDAQGSARGARITAAATLTAAEVDEHFAERIEQRRTLRWNDQAGRVEARLEKRLGAITLSSGPDPSPDANAVEALLLETALAKRDSLLPANLVARSTHAGVMDLASADAELWLAPLLKGRRDLALEPSRVAEALLATLDWDTRQRLDRVAPRAFTSPAGTQHTIDYTGDGAPSVEVRVQALFGLDEHPMIGGTPLLLQLTSPAGRPIQATRDLPGFWRGSWADVRKEMKGRYPKHRWPEEPWREAPSLKTKRAFSNSPG